MRILACQALPLQDLAKVTPTCKLFHEGFLEVCEAEAKLLADSGVSTFG